MLTSDFFKDRRRVREGYVHFFRIIGTLAEVSKGPNVYFDDISMKNQQFLRLSSFFIDFLLSTT
jgi:hypothetical protein